MIRVVIENILLFLLPTIVYVVYVSITRRDAKTGPLDGAPIGWLVLAGTLLVFVTLAAFGTSSGSKPGSVYVPSQMKDGKIEPGRLE
jgi:hypothetical protein